MCEIITRKNLAKTIPFLYHAAWLHMPLLPQLMYASFKLMTFHLTLPPPLPISKSHLNNHTPKTIVSPLRRPIRWLQDRIFLFYFWGNHIRFSSLPKHLSNLKRISGFSWGTWCLRAFSSSFFQSYASVFSHPLVLVVDWLTSVSKQKTLDWKHSRTQSTKYKRVKIQVFLAFKVVKICVNFPKERK